MILVVNLVTLSPGNSNTYTQGSKIKFSLALPMTSLSASCVQVVTWSYIILSPLKSKSQYLNNNYPLQVSGPIHPEVEENFSLSDHDPHRGHRVSKMQSSSKFVSMRALSFIHRLCEYLLSAQFFRTVQLILCHPPVGLSK